MVYYLGYNEPGSTYPSVEFAGFEFTEVRLAPDSSRPNAHLVKGVGAFQAGEAIDPEHVPTTLRWASSRAPYDYITLHGSSIVSPRMKEIIERYEPGVHQFFPLTVVNKAGEEIAERWLWVVCNNIDSVDREHSNLNLIKGQLWSGRGVVNPRLVFSKNQIAARHFWRDALLLESDVLCSDEAGAALESASLTAIQLRHKETV